MVFIRRSIQLKLSKMYGQYQRLNMLFWSLAVVVALSDANNSNLLIEQTRGGILNEATDLRCILGGNVTSGYFIWKLKSCPAGEGGDINVLAQVVIANDDVTVVPAYKDKVSASWQPGVFTLTIKKLSLRDDEKLVEWICVFENGPGIKAYHGIKVKVPPTSETTNLSGIVDGWVTTDRPYILNCTTDPIKPDASVYWSIDGETQEGTLTTSSENGDGTFRVTGVLSDYQFNKTRSKVSVNCLVTVKGQPTSVIFTQPYDDDDVDVYWPATTRVTNNTNYPPIEGRRYEMTCEVTDVNPDPTGFRWQGESSIQQILVIAMLERPRHSKTFSCAADNTAGQGEFGEGLDLQVWYPPFVSVSGDVTAGEGSSVTLTCSSTDAFPKLITKVQWKKDGKNLSRGDTEGGDVNNPNITLKNLQKSDAGAYTCVLDNGAGYGESPPLTLDVQYWPEGSSMSVTPARSEIAVGEAVTFTCQHTGDSNPQPNAYTFYKDGERQQNSSSKTWTLGTSSIHDGGAFSCEASNSIGAADKSEEKVITVQAPATIEAFPADAQSPEYDAEFSMACVGAGNERTVEWTKDGADLPEGDFVDDGSGTVQGTYSFGQEQAYKKSYQMITAPAASCSSVERHNGEYTCTVTATAGETETRNSSTMQLSVRYPPINKDSDFLAVHVGLRVTATLPCDVCANPEPTQYTWSRPDGAALETSESSLTISNITEDDFGNYTCSVTNSIASSTFVVLLAALGVPEQPSAFRVVPKTSRSVDLSWKPGFNGGLIQTFELDGRKVGEPTYVNIKRNIADPNTHPKDDQTVSLTVDLIKENALQPNTSYEFRVRGENSHEDQYGPYAIANGKTNESPVVKLNADTLSYSHDTTHLFFEWKIEAGKPDKLELQYRESPSQSQSRRRPRRRRSAEWITMVTVDPDPGVYDGVTGVELDPDRSYELRLVPFEGAQSTTPPDEDATPLKPSDPPDSILGLVVGMVMAAVCVAGVAIAGTVYLKRRNKKEDGSTPIINGSQEQVGMTHQTFTGPGAQAQLDNAAYATVDMAAKARSRGPPPPTPTPLTKLPPIPTPPPADEPQPSTSKEGYDDPKPGTSLEMTTDSEEEENPYADAPPMYDHYVEGDIYAMVGPPDKILYSNYPGQEKVESEYWDVIYLGPEKEVNIPPRFEEPIYDWIDFTKEPGPADSDSD